MPNPLSKVAAIILAIILTILVPVYNQYWMIDRMIYNQVNVITNRFQKEVRTRGYINNEMYDNFLKDLEKTGRTYDIKMLHRKAVYYPLKPGMEGYSNEKPWTVEFFKYNERDILTMVYNRYSSKPYIMKSGDDFTVSVMDKSLKGSRIFWGLFGGSKTDSSIIFATYGGMIENEAN